MELSVYQKDGIDTGRTVVLGDAFDIEPHDHVLWLDVRRTQAARRSGTAKTKERGEITGSTRKLYRQKGTGMARSGSVKSPLRRGGGRTFGPRPRKYRLRLSKKTRRLARNSALSYRLREEEVHVVDALEFNTPSTAWLSGILGTFGLDGSRVLVVTASNSPHVFRSSTNLHRVVVREARNICAEDVLRARTLLIEEGAVAVLN